MISLSPLAKDLRILITCKTKTTHITIYMANYIIQTHFSIVCWSLIISLVLLLLLLLLFLSL